MGSISTESVLAIVGIILSLLGSWAIFILSGIKRSQDNTNKEIKEMNSDIRDILVNMGKHGEQVISLAQRFTELYNYMSEIDKRVQDLEKVNA